MSTRVRPEAGAVAFFTDDHRACDDLWAAVEAAGEKGDGAALSAAFATFDQAMRRHLAMEEEVLFPAFEEKTGITMGPTRVMRMEHDQMRGLLAQMAQAAASDPESVLDHGDTLLMLIQQHNMKEEGMLYPMCDGHLRQGWGEIAGRLARY